MIDEISLLRGEDYLLPCGIVMKHPHLRDILLTDYSEEQYYQFIYSFCAVPGDYRVALYDGGIDCDEISDFELFLMLYNTFTPEQTQIIFGDLDFTQFRPARRNADGALCLVNPKTQMIIDELNFLLAVEFVRKINGMKRKNMKAGNAATKAFLIDDERIAMRFRKKKKFESILFPLISSMVNSPGFKHNYQECMELPVFAFCDSVSRIQIIKNHDALVTGIYSGSIDGKKISKEQFNWMSRV